MITENMYNRRVCPIRNCELKWEWTSITIFRSLKTDDKDDDNNTTSTREFAMDVGIISFSKLTIAANAIAIVSCIALLHMLSWESWAILIWNITLIGIHNKTPNNRQHFRNWHWTKSYHELCWYMCWMLLHSRHSTSTSGNQLNANLKFFSAMIEK